MMGHHRYRHTPVLSLSLAAILAVSALGSGQAAAQFIIDAAAADRVPEGLSTSDWSSIRAAYEARRHTAFAVDGGYQARNPGQQWRTRFDGRGFLTTPDAGGWSWGLDLVSYGRAGVEQAVTAPSCVEADGGRVCYQWDEALTEWYANDGRGLEHGYTIQRRPECPTGGTLVPPLQLTLAIRGGLRPRLSANGHGVTFVSNSGAAVVNYHGLTVYDAGGVALPAWFEASSEALVLSVDDRGARYPLTVDPIAQQAYLKASNTGFFDVFGGSVSVSGDTVVVGAQLEDSSATGVDGNQADNSAALAGAAYVFVRDAGGNWSQQAYLKASNTDKNDRFGGSVSVSGDTVVVGASGEDSSATGVDGNQGNNLDLFFNAGAAYVFVRGVGGVWSQQAYLKASNTDAGDRFGWSVAVSGDTVVVGASRENSSATGVDGNQADNSALVAGAAYVFVRDAGGVWSQQGYLKASNTDSGDQFGKSVAVSGDTVVVAAPRETSSATGVDGNQADNSASRAGAAYVFVRDAGGVWSQQAYLKASNTDAVDFFGSSVGASGDTVVVGAHQEDSSATGIDGNQADNSAVDAGAAYVFVRDAGGIWSQQAYLKASNTDAGDSFGSSVAASGNMVVVGASGEESRAKGLDGDQADNSFFGAGAVYIFVRDAGGVWTQQTYLKASNTGISDGFGSSVSASGNTLVVGAPGEDSSATGVDGNQADNSAGPQAGAAYVFAPPPDCNANGIPDATDIANGTSLDCSANGIPDECETDCNTNGIPDECDIDPTDPDGNGQISIDCNLNGIPDECDIDPTDPDVNGQVSADCQPDAIPDECQTGVFIYSMDDGTGESFAGLSTGGSVAWMNHFTVNLGSESIGRLRLAWGPVANGTSATVYLWSDPNGDGNPSDAQVLASAPTTVQDSGTNLFTDVAIPNTLVGSLGTSFFAGVIIAHQAGEQPTVLDTATLAGQTWLVADGTSSIDPNNLGASAFPPFVTSIGVALVRAVPLGNDCNNNGIPDDCEGSEDVAIFIGEVIAAAPNPFLTCLFDVNVDGKVDGLDIQPFVDRLLGP